jgi:hypothetical protein
MIDAIKLDATKADATRSGATSLDAMTSPEGTVDADPLSIEPATTLAGDDIGFEPTLSASKVPLATNAEPDPALFGQIGSGFDWNQASHVPMMASTPAPSNRGRVWLLAILLILAAGGAGVYSQIDRIQGLLGGGDNKSAPPVTVNTSAPPSIATKTAAQQPPAANREPSQPAAENGQAVQAAPPQAAAQTGRDLFSLQAASFPNEPAAREFSEKLVRAGVPAYVIAADIPKRGRWYRVRAGKFATQEEARKHGLEWQQRARAAGFGIQLVACAFEQP